VIPSSKFSNVLSAKLLKPLISKLFNRTVSVLVKCSMSAADVGLAGWQIYVLSHKERFVKPHAYS
jgi:hypothetical protein